MKLQENTSDLGIQKPLVAILRPEGVDRLVQLLVYRVKPYEEWKERDNVFLNEIKEHQEFYLDHLRGSVPLLPIFLFLIFDESLYCIWHDRSQLKDIVFARIKSICYSNRRRRFSLGWLWLSQNGKSRWINK